MATIVLASSTKPWYKAFSGEGLSDEIYDRILTRLVPLYLEIIKKF